MSISVELMFQVCFPEQTDINPHLINPDPAPSALHPSILFIDKELYGPGKE